MVYRSVILLNKHLCRCSVWIIIYLTNKTWLWEQYDSLRSGQSKIEWYFARIEYIICFTYYIRWHLISMYFYLCAFWSSVRVYFVVQKRKRTVVNYVTTLWITLPFYLAVNWIQAQLYIFFIAFDFCRQLHRKLYMKHPKTHF